MEVRIPENKFTYKEKIPIRQYNYTTNYTVIIPQSVSQGHYNPQQICRRFLDQKT